MKWLPSPVFLPGEFYGQRSVVGWSLWGLKESDTPEQLTLRLFHNIESSSLCYTVGPCWLSVLNIVVYMFKRLTLFFFLHFFSKLAVFDFSVCCWIGFNVVFLFHQFYTSGFRTG